MFTDDGDFFKRIKTVLNTGKFPEEETVPVKVETEVKAQVLVEATTDLLPEEEVQEQLTPQTDLKQQILDAMNERPATLVDYKTNISETPPIALRTVTVTAPAVVMPEEKDLDIRFATKFIGSGGKFIFCENMRDVVDSLNMLKAENGWEYIFSWENEIKDIFTQYNFQRGAVGFTIENSDAAISLCETLVADEGIIILNPKQASRRRLPVFPKAQIIFTDVSHLIGSEAEGLERFYKRHKGELPSIIKIGSCNNGHFYDKQRLILNAEGPEDVYVILVDDLIPPSLRP